MLGARTHGPLPLQRKLPRGQLYLPDLRRIGQGIVASLSSPTRGARVDALEARFAAALESREAALFPHARIALLEILRALDGEKLPIQQVALANPSLDEVFLQHTGRTMRSEDVKPIARGPWANKVRR